MQIADLSVENMFNSFGQKGFVARPTSDCKTQLVNFKPELLIRTSRLRILRFSCPRHNKFATRAAIAQRRQEAAGITWRRVSHSAPRALRLPILA